MIYEFNGIKPYVHPTSFVHPQANVTGAVSIGAKVYIGPGAVLRGDWGRIFVADGCNIQENCVVHMFPGKDVVLEKNAHIGHGAIVHGAHIGANCLIGMNAVLMDDVELGEGCIVGALAFLPANLSVPQRKLVVGNPAKIIKEVSDEMLAWKTKGTELYQQLPAQCQIGLRECNPHTDFRVPDKPMSDKVFQTWNNSKSRKD